MDTLPPAVDRPLDGALLCGHNVLKAHAEVSALYHQKYAGNLPNKGKIGINLDSSWSEPKIWSKSEDVEAAWRALQFKTGWFLHPLIHGDYPEVMKTIIAENRAAIGSDQGLPVFDQAEIQKIKGSADFVGINYKTSLIARNDENYNASESRGAIIGDSRVIELPDWRDSVDLYRVFM